MMCKFHEDNIHGKPYRRNALHSYGLQSDAMNNRNAYYGQ